MTDYYPPAAFSFSVSIDGSTGIDAAFIEVSGLSTEWALEEIREGREPTAHKVPKRAKTGPLVMRRGLTLATSPLYTWCTEVMENQLTGKIQTRDITVSLLGPEKETLMAWTAKRAWPTKLEVDAFKSDESSVAIERIEFAYHDLLRNVLDTTTAIDLARVSDL